MKLASLKNGTRDGKLAVVSRDLTRYTDASFLVPTLQAALDNWQRIAPHLEAMAESLEHGAVPSSRFHEHDAMSPLPRAYQAGGGAGVFAAPRDPIAAGAGGAGGVRLAVIAGDVDQGQVASEVHEAIKLVMLAHVAGDRALAFSPVAVTPDELGDKANGTAVKLPLLVEVNAKSLEPGTTTADLGRIVAKALLAQSLAAGAILLADESGVDLPDLKLGDTLRIEMKAASGHSIFGAIERKVDKSQN